MSNTHIRTMIQIMAEVFNEEKRDQFHYLGKGKRNYTNKQKNYALSLIDTYGVRATARILQIPRRTIQRWCRKYHRMVSRCPAWVYEWAERRRRRREFWERRGYY